MYLPFSSIAITVTAVAVLLSSAEAVYMPNTKVRRDMDSDIDFTPSGDGSSANTMLAPPEVLNESNKATGSQGIRRKFETGEEGAELESDIGSYNGLVDKSHPQPTTTSTNTSNSSSSTPTTQTQETTPAKSSADSNSTATSIPIFKLLQPGTNSNESSSTVTSAASASPSPSLVSQISNSGKVTYVPISSVRTPRHCYGSNTPNNPSLQTAAADDDKHTPKRIAAYINAIALNPAYSKCVGTHRACYSACGVDKACCDDAFIKCGRETCANILKSNTSFTNCENDWAWTGKYPVELKLKYATEFGCPTFHQAQVQCQLKDSGFLGCVPNNNWGGPKPASASEDKKKGNYGASHNNKLVARNLPMNTNPSKPATDSYSHPTTTKQPAPKATTKSTPAPHPKAPVVHVSSVVHKPVQKSAPVAAHPSKIANAKAAPVQAWMASPQVQYQ